MLSILLIFLNLFLNFSRAALYVDHRQVRPIMIGGI